jgi:succinyl-CoA synthetase alpha subunit
MSADRHVDALMQKLQRAIEVSLAAAEAARDAVHEILKRGAETGVFFTEGAGPADGPAFELTSQDREFLRAVSIRPESR